jgi:rhodanese-related sulfurtransferase
MHRRSGSRSAKAVALLREADFEKARNLAGGILSQADQIDPTHAALLARERGYHDCIPS